MALAETWAMLMDMLVCKLIFAKLLSWHRALRVSAWANALSYAVLAASQGIGLL